MPDLNQHFAAVNALLKCGRFGLISDVDGTLSQIAPTPQAARLDPTCRRTLETLRDKLTLVALVSGRGVSDLCEMVGIPGLVYLGNHGLERLGETDGATATKQRIAAALEALKAELGSEGLLYEDKGVSAAIHYRASADPAAARQRLLDAIAKIPETSGLKVMENRLVVDLFPADAAGKGGAVAALIREYRLDAAIYIGDDRTDIDGFKALRAAEKESGFKGLAAAVISTEMPPELTVAADFTLDGVPAVAELLTRLASASPD